MRPDLVFARWYSLLGVSGTLIAEADARLRADVGCCCCCCCGVELDLLPRCRAPPPSQTPYCSYCSHDVSPVSVVAWCTVASPLSIKDSPSNWNWESIVLSLPFILQGERLCGRRLLWAAYRPRSRVWEGLHHYCIACAAIIAFEHLSFPTSFLNWRFTADVSSKKMGERERRTAWRRIHSRATGYMRGKVWRGLVAKRETRSTDLFPIPLRQKKKYVGGWDRWVSFIQLT